MFMRYILITLICYLFCSCATNISKELYKPYAGWKSGEMDIHHIYTGRGESNFLLLPDGTSMLIDAGDWDPNDYPQMCEALPDSSRRAGEWIARYIERVNPYKDAVDYLMISHFHNDHTGDCTHAALSKTHGRNPDYKLTGIAQVGEKIRFKKVWDRGWPDYQYPITLSDVDVDNYRAFIKWQAGQNGLRQERFVVGRKNQITLLKNRQKYESCFSIQNLAANGEIWTGKNEETVRYYDLNLKNRSISQNENSKSLAIRISYGDFQYYTGGDLSGELLDESEQMIDLEEKVALACGAVDVCKVNHHAYLDAMTEGFLRHIKAKSYVIPVWDNEHIQPAIINRMLSKDIYAGNRMIFPTHISDKLYKKYDSEAWMSAVCPQSGHVVVKVYDGGRKYKIYVLSAQDERMTVRAIYGPYKT